MTLRRVGPEASTKGTSLIVLCTRRNHILLIVLRTISPQLTTVSNQLGLMRIECYISLLPLKVRSCLLLVLSISIGQGSFKKDVIIDLVQRVSSLHRKYLLATVSVYVLCVIRAWDIYHMR